ncbi:MAG: hypothetical protein J6C46_10790 [Clostridia bacterium]|nr:hypothetical protein [Clostridia bacterium]
MMSNGTGDIATQIKSVFNFRKKLIDEQRRKKYWAISFLGIAIIAIVIAYYSKDTITEYNLKHQELNFAKQELEEQKNQVEQEMEQVEIEKNKVLSEAEIIAQNNLYLVEQNIKLQNTLKEAASVGVKPQNYEDAETVNTAVDYSKLEYIGEFEGTAYTPSVEECSNNLGYTASGKPIIAGVSIAVDNEYWKFGTKFYIEGLGYVVAMDTGSMVKGKYRFDYAVFDKDYAYKLGRKNWKVYLVNEE